MNIDWSKAPEWAVAHGLHETGFGIEEFWLGETQHQNLEHSKSFPYGGGDPSCGSFHNSRRESFSYVTERPAAWTGDGLPPVGTVCGLWFKGADQGEVTVLFIGDEVGVFKSHAFDHEQHGDLIHYQFYQVSNTQEEADAQDRKKVLAEMTALAGGQYAPRDAILQRLYDAGYRKQVKP
ncbi:hypothetical protein [Pseudomonas fluorescens]|uniref:hypothetical protein n=1 Tax=Pseudomonas fluorescens TaxID=294 RepID=UPI00069B49CA|nr:hypothetical protein [Pseudomonas fluorescens]